MLKNCIRYETFILSCGISDTYLLYGIVLIFTFLYGALLSVIWSVYYIWTIKSFFTIETEPMAVCVLEYYPKILSMIHSKLLLYL